jgi:hypothetical protein
MLLTFHDFDLARNGEFDADKGAAQFNTRVRGDWTALSRDLASKGDPALRLKGRTDEAIKFALSPGSIEPLVAEDYNLETGTWIGATLEQGVWYQMTVQLPLAPQLFVMHKIEFAYTRSLPCTTDFPGRSCVEIVLHAVPDTATLSQLARAFASRGQPLRCSSVTDMRLVTDPATLQPYLRDTRRHSYWSMGANHSLIESDRMVFVSSHINRLDIAPGR